MLHCQNREVCRRDICMFPKHRPMILCCLHHVSNHSSRVCCIFGRTPAELHGKEYIKQQRQSEESPTSSAPAYRSYQIKSSSTNQGPSWYEPDFDPPVSQLASTGNRFGKLRRWFLISEPQAARAKEHGWLFLRRWLTPGVVWGGEVSRTAVSSKDGNPFHPHLEKLYNARSDCFALGIAGFPATSTFREAHGPVLKEAPIFCVTRDCVEGRMVTTAQTYLTKFDHPVCHGRTKQPCDAKPRATWPTMHHT